MINNNRQAGRRRGRGGQQQRPQGNSGRQDTGNRIDNRSRGNAAQLLEKYKSLARDAQQSGDRVNTEYYLQFADHYFRVLAETRSRLEENNRAPIQGGANTFQDDEQDYDDEGEPVARAEQPRQNEGQRADQGRQDGNRADGNRQDGNRVDRQDQGRQDQGRQDQNRQQNYQGDRQNRDRDAGQDRQGNLQQDRSQDRSAGDRDQRVERAQYDDDRPRRPNGNGGYGNDSAPDRYVRDANRGNRDRYQNEDRAPVQQEAASSAVEAAQAEAPRVQNEQPLEAPRRRGRPRREPAAEAPAAFAESFEADRLPPSLTISAVAQPAETVPANDLAGDEPAEKPRRRRGRPPASEATNV